MGLPRLKGKGTDEVEFSISTCNAAAQEESRTATHIRYNLRKRKQRAQDDDGNGTDEEESSRTNAAAQEESETSAHLRYNLRKRKQRAQDDDGTKVVSPKRTRGSKSIEIRQRNNQRSTTIVKPTKNETVKQSDIKVKQLRSSVKQKAHIISQSKRNSVQVNKTQKTRTKTRAKKRKLLITKEHHNENKATSNVRKNPRSIPKTDTSSKGATERLQNVHRSSNRIANSTLKRGQKLESPRKGQTADFKTSKRKASFMNNQIVTNFSKLDVKTCINVGIHSQIHGMCVTNDNLVWVNYLLNHVKLFDASGNVLRSVSLEQPPVFNCCTPTGDLLFTQGYAGGSRAEVMMVPREGNPRILADLSSYARNLSGILCKDDRIYVVGQGHHMIPAPYFIIKLDLNGEVEGTYEAEPGGRYMNNIILQKGRIFAIGFSCDLFPLENNRILATAMNKVNITPAYSPSACVDNFGNVIFSYISEISIVDSSLKFKRVHKIRTKISDSILSTAVDHDNQLWLGTNKGDIYIAKYMDCSVR